jgi:hypothetical protein
MGKWVLSTFTGKLIFGGSFEAREVTDNQFPKKFQKNQVPREVTQSKCLRKFAP